MRHLRPIISQNPVAALRNLVADVWLVPRDDLPRVGTMQADGRVGVVVSAKGWGRSLRVGPLRPDGEGTRARPVQLAAGTSLVGVRFEPGAFRSIFALPYREFVSGRTTPELEAWSQTLDNLVRELVKGSASWEEFLPELVAPIAALVREPDQDWHRVARAVRVLSDPESSWDCARLARQCGWSRRQFERQFAAQVGMSPKVFGRTQRVGHARRLLKQGANLTETAQSSGFADQAHLCREFRSLLGTTPLRYQRRRRPGDEPA